MQSKTLFVIPLLLLSAGTSFAQVTLNPVPTREIAHPRLLPNFDVDTASPNLVEGRELFNPAGIALDTSVSPPMLYVADSVNNRVLAWKNALSFRNGDKADFVIGQSGSFLTTGPQGPGTNFTAGLSRPTGLLVDAN